MVNKVTKLFVLLALTPVVVWLILKIHPGTAEHRRRWFAMVYLVFATHVLLDSFTVYGTQIFWPFISTPMTWSTIFIIDPIYTVPLLLGITAALIAGRRYSWGHVANYLGLVISTGYLMWTIGAKLHVEQVARNSLQQQNIASTDVLTTPSPFNSLLWRILVVNDEHYYEGFYSVLDDDVSISFEQHPRKLELIEPLSTSWPVQRLHWFTKNFYQDGYYKFHRGIVVIIEYHPVHFRLSCFYVGRYFNAAGQNLTTIGSLSHSLPPYINFQIHIRHQVIISLTKVCVKKSQFSTD